MDNRMIIVPLNSKAIKEIEYIIEIPKERSKDYLVWYLSEEEYNELDSIFYDINIECNLMIEDFESERIPNSKLRSVRKLLEGYSTSLKAIQKFQRFVKSAEASDSFIDLDF